MMYASRALPDRFPHRVGEVRLAYPGTLGGEPTIHAPRTFDPAMHNEPNPILIEFRQTCADEFDLDGWYEALRTALVDPGDWGLPDSVYDGTDEQVIHAHDVVKRMVLLQEST